MTEKTVTKFTCDGCGAEVVGDRYASTPHGWRKLTWCGAYVGDEGREAHFCGTCRPKFKAALDVLLGIGK